MADKYVKNGMKILDIGCGNGRLLQALENRGIEYVGVDNSRNLISIC
ncbi:MAG: class I SAM-dependent methyltransferase [bacterium]